MVRHENRANAAARGTWVLSLDADEALTRRARTPSETSSPVPYKLAEARVARGGDQPLDPLRQPMGAPQRMAPGPKGALVASQAPVSGKAPFTKPCASTARLSRVAWPVWSNTTVIPQSPTICSKSSALERSGRRVNSAAGRRSSVALALLKVVAQWCKTALLRGGFRDGATGWAIARRSAWPPGENTHAFGPCMHRLRRPAAF